MYVRLVSNTERIRHEIGGTTFILKRLSPKRARQLRKKFTPRGAKADRGPDTDKMHAAILGECLVGWEKLQDGDGGWLEYGEDVKGLVIDQLPTEATAEIVERIMSPYGGDEGDGEDEADDDVEVEHQGNG